MSYRVRNNPRNQVPPINEVPHGLRDFVIHTQLNERKNTAGRRNEKGMHFVDSSTNPGDLVTNKKLILMSTDGKIMHVLPPRKRKNSPCRISGPIGREYPIEVRNH